MHSNFFALRDDHSVHGAEGITFELELELPLGVPERAHAQAHDGHVIMKNENIIPTPPLP